MPNSKLKFFRDETTSNSPSADQIEVGEIFMNSVVGKLYMKLVDGTIVEFAGSQICYDTNPEIYFSDLSEVCCYGDTFNVDVSGLQRSPKTYSFEVEELTDNKASINVASPMYENYTGILPNNPSNTGIMDLRSASVPIYINVDDSKLSVTLLKFKILSDNNLITEKVASVRCKNCGSISPTPTPQAGF